MSQSPSILKHLRDILILPFTVTVIVPWLIYNSQQTFIPYHPVLLVLGIIIGAAGLSLFLYTVFLFKTIGKGTLAPWTPTQRLVITGPYRYCRNPMITGVFGILMGETLILHSLNIAIWAGTFLIINTCYFIFFEEPSMEKRFGEDYRKYKRQVSRWVPRVTPYRQPA